MDGWDKFYECVVDETDRLVDETLERFRVSLEDWLFGQMNWPTPDWEQQLKLFVDHSRYYGVIVHDETIQTFHDLLEARVNGTGPFAAYGPYRWDQPTRGAGVPIQPAIAIGFDDGTRTDATVALDPGPTPTFKDGAEVAGPGPATTSSFQDKVQLALELIDVEVAQWWKQSGGVIRSRSATGWWTFYRRNHESFMEGGRPVIVVDENYTVGQAAEAIDYEAKHGRAESMKPHFTEYWLHHKETAERFHQLQTERFKEGAAFAGWAAEAYYNTIGSLTPAGDVVVTVNDAAENGLRWDHFLILLPLMSHFRKGVKKLIIQLPRGRQLQLSGDVIDRLIKLSPTDRAALIAKARAAKTEEEGLAIIERGVRGRRKPPAPGSKPKSRPKTIPKRGPGKWQKVVESMPPRAQAYQAQVTGRKNHAYVVKGVKFDGYTDGVLLEAKGPGYVKFVNPPDTFKDWFTKQRDILLQATYQAQVAAGVPIEWHVADAQLKPVLENMFKSNGITSIKVIHTPAP
jgi:hypothetical protein